MKKNTRKKPKKMDRKLVASKQPHEVRHIVKKFGLDTSLAIKLVGGKRSRIAVYEAIIKYLLNKS